MRSSWAGAMGHPQLLPSEFYKYAVDFDGDGRRDIWTSVPDALATIANHLVELGWQGGMRWAYEVKPPRDIDCTVAQPDVKMSIGEWLKRGYVPAHGARLAAAELAQEASLLMPAGPMGQPS
jgi:membrane-bound lytic murein transglycosylase B